MSEPRVLSRGTTEYLRVSVTSDVSLDAQPVAFSFDRNTWLTGEWEGDTAATTRVARVLLAPSDLPIRDQPSVYIRVTDTTETPVIKVDGILEIV